jgi:hypothetical protein
MAKRKETYTGMDFEKIFSLLQKNKIEYIVVGGLAVNLYGAFRATMDLDILLLLEESNVKKYIHVVNELGFVPRVPVSLEDLADDKKRNKWIKEKNMQAFSVFHPSRVCEHIDVIIDSPVSFKQAAKRKEILRFGKIAVPVISLNELISMKRKAGRDKDLIDLEKLQKIRRFYDEENKK